MSAVTPAGDAAQTGSGVEQGWRGCVPSRPWESAARGCVPSWPWESAARGCAELAWGYAELVWGYAEAVAWGYAEVAVAVCRSMPVQAEAGAGPVQPDLMLSGQERDSVQRPGPLMRSARLLQHQDRSRSSAKAAADNHMASCQPLQTIWISSMVHPHFRY